MTTLRYVLALASLLKLRSRSADFNNAFLNTPLNDDVYIYAPPGSPPLLDGHMYKLNKALFGLKQSPWEWNVTLNMFMTNKCGLRQFTTEKYVYMND